MAAIVEQMMELAMKLRLFKQASKKLCQRATKTGRDVSSVASDLIEQAVTQPNFDAPTLTPSGNGHSVAATDGASSDLTEAELAYNSVPAYRTYSVQVSFIHRGRGVSAPSDLSPE